MTLFREQLSTNREDFLQYLSSKSNIYLMDDVIGNSLQDFISNMKKQPDVILYYFLSRHDLWTTICVNDFTTYAIKLPRYMIFEDGHYHDIVIPLYKKYNFSMLQS